MNISKKQLVGGVAFLALMAGHMQAVAQNPLDKYRGTWEISCIDDAHSKDTGSINRPHFDSGFQFRISGENALIEDLLEMSNLVYRTSRGESMPQSKSTSPEAEETFAVMAAYSGSTWISSKPCFW